VASQAEGPRRKRYSGRWEAEERGTQNGVYAITLNILLAVDFQWIYGSGPVLRSKNMMHIRVSTSCERWRRTLISSKAVLSREGRRIGKQEEAESVCGCGFSNLDSACPPKIDQRRDVACGS
jgi:hypothetical protein